MVEQSESQQLDETMENLYQALLKLDEEPDNEPLKEWVHRVCDPQYQIVDGLVSSFVSFLDDKPYVTKILKILK
jgi:hypothetical protein